MLVQHHPDLWTVAHPLVVGGLSLGTRMTVVRLSDGGLLLHSPIPLGPELRAELASLGAVRQLVAPNKLHHLYLAAAAEAFPDAQVWLAPGLAAKVSSLPPHRELGEKAPVEWGGDLEALHVQGAPLLEEVVLFHQASRTLILTDLAFHIRRPEGWLQRLFWRLNDGLDRFGPTRSVRFTLRDRRALRPCIDRILDWDFDRVTVTHGEVLEAGGRAALREAFAFLPAG